jgi:hypothetical protein
MTTLYSKAKALLRPLLLPLRRLVFPLFSRVNPGDITIRHHYAQLPFRFTLLQALYLLV